MDAALRAKEKSDAGGHHSPRQTSYGALVALQRCHTLRMSKSKFSITLVFNDFKPKPVVVEATGFLLC